MNPNQPPSDSQPTSAFDPSSVPQGTLSYDKDESLPFSSSFT